MTLVDTSVWVHWLRPQGNPAVADQLDALLQAGQASWCAMVRLELWNAAAGAQEQKALRGLGEWLPELPITTQVWSDACVLARNARSAGVTAPSTDVLILACARHHGVGLVHADSDFDLLSTIPR
jgi:predicted nucleic acid-binding protein